MLKQLKKSLSFVFLSQNMVSFVLYCYLFSKAYDFAPTLYSMLSKKLKPAGHDSDERKHFGRFKLPLAKCLFFRDTRVSCLHHKEPSCFREDCLKKSLRDLFALIRAAEKEILVCCYNFSFVDLANVIMEAKDRNVNVRVIANFESCTSSDSAIHLLQKKGIRIKMRESGYIFHHKFIILDQTVLINGSTNFTDKGIFANIDSLLATSDPFFVERYLEEFNYLWNTFELTF